MASFGKAPWTGVLFASAVAREELSVCRHIVALGIEDPCLGSVCTTVVVGPALFIDLSCLYSLPPPSQSTALHQRRGLSCLSLLPESLPAVCPLVGLLAAVAALALELDGAFVVNRALCFSLGLGFALALVELAIFRRVAGTSACEASPCPCFCRRHQRPSVSHLDSTPGPSLSKIPPNGETLVLPVR